jgi:hypothetical protein
MKHLRNVSCARPASAQVQAWLDILTLITATLNLLVLVANIFGFELNKGEGNGGEV